MFLNFFHSAEEKSKEKRNRKYVSMFAEHQSEAPTLGGNWEGKMGGNVIYV